MVDVRTPTTPDELDAALRLDALAFHLRRSPEAEQAAREELASLDAVAAFDGRELVGVAGAHDLSLTVPGGELACAGVTWVGVLPTHRRRGVLSGMLDELHARADARGAPIAALFAAEAAIYGRFGYGAATWQQRLDVDAGTPLEVRIEPSRAPLRLLDAADALGAIRALHDELRPRRGGRPARDEAFWRERKLRPNPDGTSAPTPLRVVVLGAPGQEEGYAIYDTTAARWPSDRVRVDLHELEARTPAGEAALWRYLTSIDLVAGVDAEQRPDDDAVLAFAADPDRVRVTGRRRALWVRVLDVPAALAARALATDLDLVLAVADPRRPANAGGWRLRPGSCTPTRDDADLALDVRELGSLLLGGVRVAGLVQAGLVQERTPGAAAALDAALAVPRAPFAPEYW